MARGQDDALIAAALDGGVHWRHAAGGQVVAIDWAASPAYIAYVVPRRVTADLHVIWANGLRDRVVARGVATSPATWTADTRAVRFAWASGRAAAWDRASGRIRPPRA